MRAVNLLPRQSSNRSLGFDRTLVAGIVVTVLVAVAVGGGFYLAKANASTEQQRLVVAQAALARAVAEQTSHPSAHAKLQVPVVLSQDEPWHVALDAALSTRVAWDVLLSQLEYVVPSRVILTTVSIGPNAAGATTAPISIGGNAFSANDIAVFLSNLTHVPKLSQVTLLSSTAAAGSGVLNFQIQAQVTLPATPTAAVTPTDTTTTTGG